MLRLGNLEKSAGSMLVTTSGGVIRAFLTLTVMCNRSVTRLSHSTNCAAHCHTFHRTIITP